MSLCVSIAESPIHCRHSPRSVPARGLRVFLAVIGLLFAPTFLFAGGADVSGREDDIRMNADWRWAGGSHGGYYPIRISLQNAGTPRTIDVELRPNSGDLPTVSRRVSVDQNASATFSLLVPLVGEDSFSELRVYANGRELESLRTPVTLPSSGWGESPFATLVISSSPVALPEFEAAVVSLTGTGSYGGFGNQRCDLQHVEPVRLPDSWLAYSCLDLVITSLDALEKLDALQRKAILDWTLTGGCLAISSDRQQAVELQQSIDDLATWSSGTPEASWDAIPLRLRSPVTRIEVDEYGNQQSSHPGTAENFKWPATDEALRVRQHSLGRIVTLPPTPFDGTYQDWAWLLNGIQFRQRVVPTRLGVSGRSGNRDFLAFLIPGVRSVPVVAFAVVMSLFAILIGPVNYYALAKRKRQGFLVVTIPAIALLSSLAMFAYSFVAHGVSVRSRARSVTWIDQQSQSAVSMSRIAWFAGFAPSDGLEFSTSTAFIPIWHHGGGFSGGSVDWTDSQNLSTGFLRSRTRTQALTIGVRDERGRLTVTSNPGMAPTASKGAASGTGEKPAGLSVTSGLEWPLEKVIVWDDDGNAFATDRLDPGQAATLAPLTDDAVASFREEIQRSTPAIPTELSAASNELFEVRRAWNQGDSYSVSQGQLERSISRIAAGVKPQSAALARHYIAIAAEPPGIEFGTEVTVVDGWHLIVGQY